MAISKLSAASFQDNVKFRNIIINGDMSISQRGTSTASITGAGYYTVDRFRTAISSLGTFTQSQSTDVPSGQGFSSSLKMDCTTADASPSGSDQLIIQQKIEGQNLQYLKKGTANAESLTLSFWVKSNKTGTYITNILDNDNSRQISNSYTINASNTWEKKTLTFAGDTTGVFDNDNNTSIELNFWLGAGSNYTSGTLQTSWTSSAAADLAVGQVNLADNTANEWYITGVQLEAGTTASDFEFLPFDVNLQRCQRYYQTTQSFVGNGSSNTSQCVGETAIGIPMRATPSLSLSGNFVITDGYTSDYTQSSASIGVYSNSAETRSFMVIIQNLPTLVTAKPYHARHSNSSVIQFSSEL
jgi:hypothetical protein